EQPESLRNTLRGRLLEEEGTVRLGGLNITDEDLLKIQRIVITACGTSWHSALIGEYMMEELARVPTEVEYASEIRYRNPIVHEPDRGARPAHAQNGPAARALDPSGARGRAGAGKAPRAGRARARDGAAGRADRRAAGARAERAVPGPRLQLPGGARGRAEAEGNQLRPRRGLPGGGDEARPHRADRRSDAGGVHRAAGRRVPEGGEQCRRSESAW